MQASTKSALLILVILAVPFYPLARIVVAREVARKLAREVAWEVAREVARNVAREVVREVAMVVD